MDITGAIADLSMGMSQQNMATQVSAKMLSKTMDTSEAVAGQMIDNLQSMPTAGKVPPGGVTGHLLDCYA